MNRELANKLTIMKLPFSFGKKGKKEHFLALLFRDEKINAVIFEELNGKIQVVGKHEAHFSDSVETADIDELLNVLDEAISKAESSLVGDVEAQKTIFGVKENWVEDAKIKKEYLIKLKKASDALGLSPIGFLVIHEAVAHLMQQEEGAPVSAILVEVGKKDIAVSLLRGGKVIETKRTTIQDSVVQTTDKILFHFTNYEVLPSRIIILTNQDSSEKLSQEFIGHTWNKSLPFLHVPQITIQPKDFDAKAVLFGAATQMGFEVLKESRDKQETEESIAEEEKRKVDETFGFVREKDIANLSKEKKGEKLPDKEEKEEETNIIVQASKTLVQALISFLFMVSGWLKTLSAPMLPKLSRLFREKKKLIFFPPILIACFLLALIVYVFGLKADVTLAIRPKIVEQKQQVTFSASKNLSDVNQKIIAATPVSVVEEGSLTIPTTGKKEVGTSAKGTVTLYSRFTQARTFSQGTTLEGPNDLVFTLDKSVTIASSSADASSEPTKTNVAISAKSIGKESNLPSGTKFTVDTFDASLIVAKNDTAFSGGTKKEVSVVAIADVDKLALALSKNYESKAKNELEKKASQDKAILPVIIATNFTKKIFNKDLNEEAASVTLNASISYKSFSYTKSDVDELLENLLKETQDATYTLTELTKKNENEVLATLHAKAFLLPKLDTKKVQKDIAGKSVADAKTALLKLPQVERADIFLSPNLPFPPILPRMPNNIRIVLKKT